MRSQTITPTLIRRNFNRRLGVLFALLCAADCAPLAAVAQDAKSAKPAKIGRLSPLSRTADMPSMAAFVKGLRDLGWVEGQNFTIVSRFADGHPERLPKLAADLVQSGVDLILVGSSPGVIAAKGATKTIPIVMVTTGDPVGDGLVASLAHPEANVTGLTALGQVLALKRLELLKEIAPAITRVAVLFNSTSPYTAPFLKERERAAQRLNLQLQLVESREAATLEQAFATMRRERAEALLVLNDTMFISERAHVVELAARSRIPAVFPEREFVAAGGLMFYGAALADLYTHAAAHVDRILKGAKPADLPVEQPTKLELVINLKAAKALGLEIPASVLARTDEIVR